MHSFTQKKEKYMAQSITHSRIILHARAPTLTFAQRWSYIYKANAAKAKTTDSDKAITLTDEPAAPPVASAGEPLEVALPLPLGFAAPLDCADDPPLGFALPVLLVLLLVLPPELVLLLLLLSSLTDGSSTFFSQVRS
jgi:hypothetical protein